MAVVPLAKTANEPEFESGPEPALRASTTASSNWVGLAAGGTLLIGGLLLLTGRRRAGLVAAAAGTTLALLDQQEAARSWWNLIPVYVDGVQRVLNQVQASVEDLAVQREKLRRILTK